MLTPSLSRLSRALASGALVTVLDEWTPPFSGFYLYYPSRALMPPKLRVFVDFLRRAFAEPDYWRKR